MKKFLVGIAVVGAALFGLTACGGYDDSDYESPSVVQEDDSDGGFY